MPRNKMPCLVGLGEDHSLKHPKIDNHLINEALLDPKLMVPYFAYEPLNPSVYSGGKFMHLGMDFCVFPSLLVVRSTSWCV